MLATIADDMGHLQEALQLYEQTMHLLQVQRQLVPPELYYNAALVCQEMGDSSHYQEYLQALVGVDNQFEDVKTRLAEEVMKPHY